MASVFAHPTNGHREEVSSVTWLWAFLFGIFYFMFKGIWRHVLIQFVMICVLYAAFGAPATMFVAVMWVIYAVAAKSIVEASYLRGGYIREGEKFAVPDTSPEIPSTSLVSSNRPPELRVRPTRQCPFCAEEILAAAIKCKHCGSALEPVASEPAVEPPLRQELGGASPMPMRPPL